jgi:hypothetical protein
MVSFCIFHSVFFIGFIVMPPELATTESTAELAQLQVLAQKFHLDLITAVDNAMLACDLDADLPVEWARAHRGMNTGTIGEKS